MYIFTSTWIIYTAANSWYYGQYLSRYMFIRVSLHKNNKILGIISTNFRSFARQFILKKKQWKNKKIVVICAIVVVYFLNENKKYNVRYLLIKIQFLYKSIHFDEFIMISGIVQTKHKTTFLSFRLFFVEHITYYP